MPLRTSPPTLVICRGLPASGKSTAARIKVAGDPASWARVNRDDIRAMCHNGYHHAVYTEYQIIAVRNADITTLLGLGRNVVCDDTNLSDHTAHDLLTLARAANATVTVWDFSNIPPDVCIARDARRPAPVGADVIWRMQRRDIAGRPYPLPLPPTYPYLVETPPEVPAP